MTTTIHHLLKKYWGFDTFRPLQEEIVQSVLEGHDTLALLPTGGGKSLCYQLPAIALEGKTLVISPLIALMQDQVASLVTKGIRAAAIHSGMDTKTVDITIDNWVHGPTKLLFIAPERIKTPVMWERLKRVDLSLVAVDEAHCISQWGYDFRPSYFDIGSIRDLHPKVPFLALTATATSVVVQDICDKLGIKSRQFFQRSFRRDNLSMTVMRSEAKEQDLLNLVDKLSGTGIIYQRNRKQTREVAQLLAARGYSVTYYHGGLSYIEREQRQAAWMNDKVQIIVCTNAFGMGIDKPDVRFVIHLDVPPSIEEYYQEIGRAGRDGQPAHVVTILNQRDIASALYNYESQYYSIAEIKSFYHRLHSFLEIPVGSGEDESFDFDLSAYIDRTGIPPRQAWSIAHLLEQEGWIHMSDGVKGRSRVMVLVSGPQLNEMLRHHKARLFVVNQMLRLYEGLFSDLSDIDEDQLAKVMQVSSAQLRRQLQQLHREGIIRYQPATEHSVITVLRDRLSKGNFTIDEPSYIQRKDRARRRLEHMIAYFDASTCRQQLLLEYFGEEAGSCGRCDVCLGSYDDNYTEDDISLVTSDIKDNPPTTDMTLYLSRWPYNKRRKVKAIMDRLSKEGQLQSRGGQLLLTTKS